MDRIEQASEFVVGVCDLAIIRPLFVLIREWSRWIVRCMRIKDVHPQEKRLARLRVQPADCSIDSLACAAFGVLDKFVPLAGFGHLVVVNREPLVQPE